MYELIILGQLCRQPMHGYLIAKIINDMVGPFAKFSSGRLYPLLTELEQSGLIEPATAAAGADTVSGHRHHLYQITETGRDRFHQLMMDTSANLGEYQKRFSYKYIFLDLLPLAEQLYLLNHYINYCEAHLFHLTHEAEDLRSRSVDLPSKINAIQMMEQYLVHWDVERKFAVRARDAAATGGEDL